MKISSYEDALSYIYQQIPTTPQTEFPGEMGIKRAQELMARLGNPQEKLKVIHIAGTSGKGSTAVITSTLLVSQGFKVGLHLSPHILDIRERCQINNSYITKEKFVKYINDIVPVVDALGKEDYGKPTYFEILVALAFYAFKNEDVEYAVVETGLGGLYDGTNVVKNKEKIAVITQLGLDHTKVLGDTLSDIAYQKAGIIQEGNVVIAVRQSDEARIATEKVAEAKNAMISNVSEGKNYKNIQVKQNGTEFEYYGKSDRHTISIGLLGRHQAQNASLALAAVEQAAEQYEFQFNWEKARTALRTVRVPARADINQIKGKTVILDGAHNPQKMQAFLTLINDIFGNSGKVFVIAFKQGKDSEQMLAEIAPIASHIILTSFALDNQDMPHFSQNPHELAEMLNLKGFNNNSIFEDAQDALKHALKREEKVVVITGSLYFLSVIYQLIHSMDL